MSTASSVFFGVEVPESLLATELQNHEAPSLGEARTLAGRALAAKAVLLARADELNIQAVPEHNAEGQEETEDEARVRVVLSQEVDVVPPPEARLKEIYDANPDGFRTPPLIEASHILVAPEDESAGALTGAFDLASRLIKELEDRPERFERIAANQSACPSASEGGTLGQLRPGDVLQDIWDALFALQVGEISTQPVQTEHGWHVLRLDHRADGARLPFQHVRPHISAQIEAHTWTVSAARYVDELLSQSAANPGLKLDAAGGLSDGESTTRRATDLLGSALSDTSRALSGLSADSADVVESVARSREEPPETVLRQAISSFLASADDDAWTQIISRLRDSESPLPDCLDVIVSNELPPLKAKKTLILTRGGRGAPKQEKGQSHGTG